MLLLAGLGNPGRKYENHRHNVGFMAADAIHRRHSFAPWSKKFGALVSDGRLAGDKVLLIKPQTYMNHSGQAVGEALRFHKLSVDDLLVMYDELDLPQAKLRIKRGGGSGGHNGIRSIDSHCGTGYRRMRIGIGHPGDRSRVTSHVLGDFAKSDRRWLDPFLEAVADNAEYLMRGDDSGFMNRMSLATEPTGGPPAGRKSQDKVGQGRGPVAPAPRDGPMATMLKRLFGKD